MIRRRSLVSLALIGFLVSACGAGPSSPSASAAAVGVTQAVGSQPVPSSAPATASAVAGSSEVPRSSAVPASPAASPAPQAPASTAPSLGAAPQPVPADLTPPLSNARQDSPIIYADGCHLGFAVVTPPPCTFGVTSSRRIVVLIGDSHAAQWFPAFDRLARQRDWRLVSLTKSACTAADVSVWNSPIGGPYTACDAWRRVVLARIAALHPDLVVVSSDRLYQLAISGRPVALAARPDVWDAGLARTLTALSADAGTVVLLGDTPRSRFDVPRCLAAHLADARACATPLARATDPARIAADRAVADQTGARFVDPTPWVCPSDPCPAIIGNLLVYREQDHLTAAFVDSLEPRLASALLP